MIARDFSFLPGVQERKAGSRGHGRRAGVADGKQQANDSAAVPHMW
jgi:hypothetical protein